MFSPSSFFLLLVTLSIAAFVTVAALGAAAEGAARSKASSSGLVLLAPPSYVTPSQPFGVRLGLPRTLDRRTASIQLAVYPCLGNRSAFDQTLQGNLQGQPQYSDVIPLSSLPADPSDPGGGVDLSVPVDAGGSVSGGSGPFTARLSCNSSYYGVYPVQIQVVGTSSAGARLLTYLVYTYPSPSPQPLRFALVVPISTVAVVPTPNGEEPELTGTQLESLDSLLTALSASRVPVSIAPSPSTISELSTGAGTGRSRQTLDLLSTLAAQSPSAGRQVLCGPFAPVDANSLVSAGLGTELAYQVREGFSTLTKLHVDCTGSDTWVASSTLGERALQSLASLGFTNVVVPQIALAGPAPSSSQQRLFELGTSRSGSLLAAMADPELSSRLHVAGPDPALAAHQLLAELEQIYFDAPNTSQPRGVVAVAPAAWGTTPAFVSEVLQALSGNPMVEPVTLSELFSPGPDGVPVGGVVGGVVQPSQRRPANPSVTDSVPAGAIREQRSMLQGFSEAVSGSTAGVSEAQRLDHSLLVSESGNLSPSQQRTAVTGASNALSAQLHSLSVTAGTIRLASNNAPVPITLSKNLPYPVTGLLQVTSDKLVFPESGQSPGALCRAPIIKSSAGRSSYSALCQITHSTNVVYVDMRTRATGDFRFSVSFTSPSGGLVLTGAQLTVRSMSFSAVSIALSVAAVAVLLLWWGRTAMRKRRARATRRPAHARGTFAAP